MYWFNRVFVPALKRRISMVSNLPDILYGAVKPFLGFTADGTGRRGVIFANKSCISRIFQNLEAVRAAVADFVERYNQTWRLEKLGYHTPIEAREEYELRQAA